MPAGYIIFHMLCCAVCLIVALRLPAHSRAGRILGIVLAITLVAGLAVERREAWSWAAMGLLGSGLVFLTNLLLEATIVLSVILWRAAPDRVGRRRAGVLSALLLGAALWSYFWYFEPLPPHLTGVVDRRGYCPQTSEDSCSAASAAMLLARHGIPATEAEMATLCLTRRGRGTTPLGLYRGLALRAATRDLRPQRITIAGPSALRKSDCPCILSVGLKSGCTPAIEARMISYGWEPGRQHTVVVLDADTAGRWIDVADPSYGIERWPTDDLNYLWDGYALILIPR